MSSLNALMVYRDLVSVGCKMTKNVVCWPFLYFSSLSSNQLWISHQQEWLSRLVGFVFLFMLTHGWNLRVEVINFPCMSACVHVNNFERPLHFIVWIYNNVLLLDGILRLDYKISWRNSVLIGLVINMWLSKYS